ncbi:MAG: PKD domain-containing protein [Chitinophagales bacterium]|nr:PKD domain-containing protein [Chitinophagales bacterium]
MKNRLLLIISICLLLMQQLQASIITVTSNADDGPGTLRAAIDSSNANFGVVDTIYFDLPNDAASRMIVLQRDLTACVDEVVIDASTQKGDPLGTSTAKVEITSLTQGFSGISLAADSSFIFGLFIHHFQYGIYVSKSYCRVGDINRGNVIVDCSAACIRILSSNHNEIKGNYIGIDTSGNTYGSVTDGIVCTSSSAIIIGGKLPGARNVISGNLNGIYLQNVIGVNITNNYIGTKYSGGGQPSVGNEYGIYAQDLNSNIDIGGDTLTEQNLISGNYQAGIYGTFYSSRIRGNGIGIDKNGTATGNGTYGIYLASASSDVIIGGDSLSQPNVIANNGADAIFLEGNCERNTFSQNSIYNNGGGITLNGGNGGIDYPALMTVSNKGVTGNAVPGYKIEVFEDDSASDCEGQTFLGSIITGANGVFTLTAPVTTLSVTATATDTAGNTSKFTPCKDTAYQSCIIPNILADSVGCSGNSIVAWDASLTLPGTSIISWAWAFGDGTVSSDQFPNHVYSDTGNYQITLYVTNDAGCSGQATANIHINASPIAILITNDEICTGSPVSLLNESSGGTNDSIVSLLWDFGDGTTSVLDSPAHSYSNPGTYTISLTVTNSKGCAKSTSVNVLVDPSPVPSFSYDSTGGHHVIFTNTSTSNGTPAYTWDFGDSTTSTSTNPVHDYNQDGRYNVCLTVFDDLCLQSIQNCQIVDIVTGVHNIIPELQKILISPNPASSHIILTNGGNVIKISSVQLLNLIDNISVAEGQKTMYQGDMLTISLPPLSNGIYLLHIETDKGILTEKILIQR